VAQPLGLPIFGVGLPGHFILKWRDEDNEIFFDPFFGGERLDQRDLEARVRDVYNPHAQFQFHWLETVGSKYILIRMLNNLKSIFLQNRQLERAWQAVDKLLILDHRAGDEIRDFGLLSLQLGAYREAATYLEQYLLAHSDAPDAAEMRIYLGRALEQIERLN
jgi:regulator of sirC expression with transglutaminase-like and TPR domain